MHDQSPTPVPPRPVPSDPKPETKPDSGQTRPHPQRVNLYK